MVSWPSLVDSNYFTADLEQEAKAERNTAELTESVNHTQKT